LRDAVPRLALKANAGGRSVADVATDVLALARQGLDRRHRLGCRDRSESQFLDPLDEIVATGRTQAEELLALYDGPWQRDITRIFRDFAF
jgi:glutamate--cysteine ligase